MNAQQKLQAAIDELRDAGAITSERRQQLEDWLDEAVADARMDGAADERLSESMRAYDGLGNL